MIRVTINNRDARATPLTPVTSGAVGLPVHFSFSEDWLQEGMTRIACFRVPEIDTIYSAILGETNETVVPWELLVNYGRVLFIGAYAENTEGTLVIPTIWADAGMIELGTQDGEQGTEPTPTQWAQIRELAEEAAGSAAAAEGYAEHGPTIINGYWCTWDGEEYETTGQKATGEDGQDGDDGVSPGVEIQTITGGHSVTITDADHPSGQSFNVMDGVDGQDGTDGVSPGVTITPITGGNTVTITDKDHPSGQSFNVLNGQDGAQGPRGPSGTNYCICSTTASTQKKEVSVSGITELADGLSLRVLFNNEQSYNGVPTLDLNSLGAWPIQRDKTGMAGQYEWTGGELLDLTYDATLQRWIIVGGERANEGHYGKTKLFTSVVSPSTTMAATPASVKTVNDKVGDGVLDSGFTATDLTGAANELKNTLTQLDSDLKYDLTVYSFSGTNTSGSIISKGAFFYNNGFLKRAATDIGVGAEITTNNSIFASDGGGSLNLLNTSDGWKYGGNTTGNTVLSLPTGDWKELRVIFNLYANPKIGFTCTIASNPNAERHYTATGYLCQGEITAAGLSATPHLLWVNLYSHNENLLIMDANSEEGVVNYRMEAWYKD